ncbi:VG15 protein [Streptomyces sp. NPDC054840]
MPPPASDGGRAAAAQRRAHRGLSRLLTRDMRGLRRLIIPSRLAESVPEWITAVRALVEQYGAASASLSADYYEAERVAAAVTGRFTVPLVGPPPEEQVENSLRWATKDLWERDPEDPATTEAQLEPMDIRLEQAEKKAEAVAQKLVADQGRGTVQEAVRQDRQATAWARAAALGACAFCKMLASRGIVYKQDTAGFRSHDGCHCGVIPVFKGQKFELSAHAREWERIYRDYAAPYPGDQLRRFRRALADHGHLPVL